MALEDGKVVFENPEHDFPQRIIYERGDEGSLGARIEGIQNGKASSSKWTWQRIPCGSESTDSGK